MKNLYVLVKNKTVRGTVLIIRCKVLALLFLTPILAVSILQQVSAVTPLRIGELGYTYCGVVPAGLWRYNLTNDDDLNSGWRLAYQPNTNWLLAVVSWHPDTAIRVYNVTHGKLIYQGILSSMEKKYLLMRNGTIFRIEASSPIFALLSSFGGIPFENETSVPAPNTFYPATDGAYVGKEFILLSSSDLQRRFTIFALEKSNVKITRDDGEAKTLTLDPNSFQSLLLYPWRIYKIESNGYIMVQSGNPGGAWSYHYSFAVPSVQGGFVGTDFYTVAASTIDEKEDYGFRVSALEETEFKVYDLTTKETLFQSSVKAGGSVRFQVRSDAIKVESGKPVSLFFVHEGDVTRTGRRAPGAEQFGIYSSYGAGVIFVGVKPGEWTPVYLPINSTCEAYIFTSEEATVEIDDYKVKVNVDSPYLIIQPGIHNIRSNRNIIVQINHWPKTPEFQGLEYPATVVPCIETTHVTHKVNLTLLKEPFPIKTYITIAGAAAAIIIVVTLLVMKKKARSK